MEPFVAAAHVCTLPAGTFWIADVDNPHDRMGALEAVTWPAEVIRQEPGCSSRFQAYTAVQAAYAVALVAEHAIKLIDGKQPEPVVHSWVRGQSFLDEHWSALRLQPWAAAAEQHDGLLIKRSFT
ncbi:molybdopterin biosynthesis protein [Pandoraea pnomenusa]|nr:molybdopterin biosynthesis protein [Pandoraea pnomenusa]